jgi:hypothetical protein
VGIVGLKSVGAGERVFAMGRARTIVTVAAGSLSLVALGASQACGTSSSESCSQGSCVDGGVSVLDGAPTPDG